MRVLHISNDYYGSPIYRNLQREFLDKGEDSIVFVPLNKNSPNENYEENVIQAKCFNGIDRLLFYTKQRKILKAVKLEIEKAKPNLLHGHFLFSSGYACMKLKQKYGIPYVIAVRSTDLYVFWKYMLHLHKDGLKVMANADKIVFINPSYLDLVIEKYVPKGQKKLFADKSVVVPNGIDKWWLQNRTHKSFKSDGHLLRLITVGVINRNKNQLTVARAVERLISKGFKVVYTVIGKIEDTKVYNRLLKHKFVHHVNRQPKEDLIKYYREADIFVMPSIQDTFGLVYAEAMSQGVPIIYSKGQGFDEQFKNGEIGYAVNCFDVEDISNRIVSIFNNYSKISHQCFANCLKFDWSTIGDLYISIYKSILSKKR